MPLWSRLRSFVSKWLQIIKNRKRISRIEKLVKDDCNYLPCLLKDEVGESERIGTLMVKCDDIGDFLVWQQVIPTLESVAQRPIYLVANKVLKDLYETYFDFADRVIWLDKSRWKDTEYRRQIYSEVMALKVHTAISFLFTRNYSMDDLIVLASHSMNSIVWDRRHHYLYPDFDRLDGMFTEIDSDVPHKLEYFRNIEFVNKVYHTDLAEKFVPLFPNFKKHDTLVVVPVASAPSKTWNAVNFAQVIQAVKNRFSRVLLIGGPNGADAASQIEKLVNDPKLMNLVNQTRLNELFAFIGEARLLLTVDTFAAHIGPLCVTDTVVVANGTNWQRFGDYEPHLKSKYKLILPSHVSRVRDKLKIYYNKSEIQAIQVETVVKAIEDILEG